MNISEISYKINEIGLKDDHVFSKIQEIRYKQGKSPRTWKPFAQYSIMDNYAFHSGGREELQFNIGEDFINDKTVFRFGIAFSLERSQALKDPEKVFKEIIERYNKFLISNPSFFNGFSFWYYEQHEFGEYFNFVRPISDEFFQTDNFLFIGKYFEKEIDEITEYDLETILETFDYLVPAYETIQFGANSLERRIARLAFNTNGWIMPSGPYGKSNHKDSHEANYGYGHEEWLFDTSKLIDGYHYGFLEPIRKKQDAYKGNSYHVWLYTIDGVSKKRYWVGEINNLEVITHETSNSILKIYQEKGWFKEMENQIISSVKGSNGFPNWGAIDFFNIRYKPEDLKVNDPYIVLPENHPIIEQSRYTFAHFKEDFRVILEEVEKDTFTFTGDEVERDDDDASKVDVAIHNREPRTIEIIYLHKAISKGLTKVLKEKYGNINVKAEHSSGIGGNKVDIITKIPEVGLVFYEIKTYNSVKTSIREALGQLFEYTMWPDKMKANQLIIITQKHNDIEDVKTYMKHLRSMLGISIYYQWFDLETNELSEKY